MEGRARHADRPSGGEFRSRMPAGRDDQHGSETTGAGPQRVAAALPDRSVQRQNARACVPEAVGGKGIPVLTRLWAHTDRKLVGRDPPPEMTENRPSGLVSELPGEQTQGPAGGGRQGGPPAGRFPSFRAGSDASGRCWARSDSQISTAAAVPGASGRPLLSRRVLRRLPLWARPDPPWVHAGYFTDGNYILVCPERDYVNLNNSLQRRRPWTTKLLKQQER